MSIHCVDYPPGAMKIESPIRFARSRSVCLALAFACISIATSSTVFADPGDTPAALQTRYRELLALFPEDRQGFGVDADKNADGPELVADHQPMTYGFVLSAEVLHYRFDRNDESARRVRKAMRWLIDNRDLDGDGKPGWGLPQAWRAWGHEPNPHHQPYTITTGIVLNGLLDALAIRDFWSAAEREETLALCAQVALRWCREMWTDGYGGGYFWYSPSPLDDIFGVNAPSMFLGSLARLLHEYGGHFAVGDRQLVQRALRCPRESDREHRATARRPALLALRAAAK